MYNYLTKSSIYTSLKNLRISGNNFKNKFKPNLLLKFLINLF